MHINCDWAVRAGIFPTSTVGEPGLHGAGVVGIQGIGVNPPRAAAVAAATVGLAILLQIPNGKIFTNGLLSIIFDIGMLLTRVRLVSSTFSIDGATPNEHCNNAPVQTPGQLMVIPPVAATVGG